MIRRGLRMMTDAEEGLTIVAQAGDVERCARPATGRSLHPQRAAVSRPKQAFRHPSEDSLMASGARFGLDRAWRRASCLNSVAGHLGGSAAALLLLALPVAHDVREVDEPARIISN